MRTVEVISPGPLTTLQDLGRPGWAHIGVPRSGAADRRSFLRANLLVRNPPQAPALETTLVGPKLRFNADTIVALTGAQVTASVGNRDLPMDAAVKLAAGDLLTVGTARRGLRTYLAFEGGIDAELTLGSASTDLLSGLGPAPLARGDVLRITDPQHLRPEDRAVALDRPMSGRAECVGGPECPTLHVVLGPRQDRFCADALSALFSEPFTVSAASNRIGVRLDGPALERADTRELLSEGLIAGALQVPGDGQPILLLADHPTTGGYPVIAVVIEADLPSAAQLRPGQQLRFGGVA
jgi:biotin-dependent carboxylase-like uncharacterized protein